jgi:hypothetical protein
MRKTYDKILICDTCYHRQNCNELPNKNGRCRLHLRDSEIELSKDLKVNPLDTAEFDYDDLKLLYENFGFHDFN